MPSPIPESVLLAFAGTKNVNISPVSSGHINNTWHLTGAGISLILQELNINVFRMPQKVTSNIRRVSEHLGRSKHPYENLVPVVNSSGDYIMQVGNSYYRAFPFIPETKVFMKTENAEMAFEAGKAFGSFDACLMDLDPEGIHTTIPGFTDLGSRLVQFDRSLEEAAPVLRDEVSVEIEQVLNNYTLVHDTTAILQKCPLRVIHGDPKVSNILFDVESKQARCIIDLDTIMPGPLLYDLSDMLRSYSNTADEDEADLDKVQIDMAIVEQLLSGYLPEIGPLLEDTEIESMKRGYAVITFIQVIRFLADHLVGNKYYKVSYPGHNLVRARNQWKLFREMQNNHNRIVQIIEDHLPR